MITQAVFPFFAQISQQTQSNYFSKRLYLLMAKTRCGSGHLHRRTWSTWHWPLTLSCFLRSRRRLRLPLTTLTIDLWVEIKNHCHRQWCVYQAIIVQFKDSWWSPVCSAPSDHHSAILASFLCRLSSMLKYSGIFFQTLSFFMSSWFVTIWTVRYRWSLTTWVTPTTLTSVLVVEGLQPLKLFFTFSQL